MGSEYLPIRKTKAAQARRAPSVSRFAAGPATAFERLKTTTQTIRHLLREQASSPDLEVRNLPHSADEPGLTARVEHRAPCGQIQPKLTLGAPDNQFEREADAVAKAVTSSRRRSPGTALDREHDPEPADATTAPLRHGGAADHSNPMLIRRSDAPDDCDREGGSAETDELRLAHSLAIRYLPLVIGYLEESDPRALREFERQFVERRGLYDPPETRPLDEMVARVCAVYKQALAGLVEAGVGIYECDYEDDWNSPAGCGGDHHIAWVAPWAEDIHICREEFFSTDRSSLERATAIIHEAVHKWANIHEPPGDGIPRQGYDSLNDAYAYDRLLLELGKRGMLALPPRPSNDTSDGGVSEQASDEPVRRACAHDRAATRARQGQGGVGRHHAGILSNQPEATAVPPAIEGLIRRQQGAGRPLPGPVRESLEPRFGADFSSVRVHADGAATRAAAALSAYAFTMGRHIFFDRQSYDPGSPSGLALLAHELTHVVQQAHGALDKRTPGQPSASQQHLENAAILQTKPREGEPERKGIDIPSLNRLADRYFHHVRFNVLLLYMRILRRRSIAWKKPSIRYDYWAFESRDCILQHVDSVVTTELQQRLAKSGRGLVDKDKAWLGPSSYSPGSFEFDFHALDEKMLGYAHRSHEESWPEVQAMEDFLRRYAVERLGYLLQLVRDTAGISFPEGLEVLENIQSLHNPEDLF